MFVTTMGESQSSLLGAFSLPLHAPSLIPRERIRTQDFIEQLTQLSTAELQDVLAGLSTLLHPHLGSLAHKKEGAGLVVVDDVTAGVVTDALVRNKFVSNYFRGGIYNGFRKDCAPVEISLPQIARERGLYGDLVLALCPDLFTRPGRVHLKIFQFSHPISEIAVELPAANRERRSLLAAITALHYLLTWSLNQLELPAIEISSPREVVNLVGLTAAERVKLDELDQRNRALLRAIAGKELPNIVVGESFTGGALSALLHSHPAVDGKLHSAVTWYHSSYKEPFGVSDTQLRSNMIADPDTVMTLAGGLLSLVPEANLAITSSGFASMDQGVADSFSIGLAYRINGKEQRSAVQVVVGETKMLPPSLFKKEYTRKIGVAVALQMLLNNLAP